jgi:hypothetical protein
MSWSIKKLSIREASHPIFPFRLTLDVEGGH